MPRGINRFGVHTEDSFKSVDIDSRQELDDLAEEEGIEVNWEKWDKLVTKTKQDIAKELKEYHKPQYTNKVFVFCLRRNRVIKTFQNPKQAADYYNISRETVTNYMREHRPYYKLMIEFRTNI